MTKKFFTRQILVVGLAILTAGCNTAQTQTSADSGTIQADIYPPEVTFAEKTVKLEVKQEFSAQDNIKTVIDDTDGNLEMKEKIEEGEAGYTVDDSEVNTEKEGTYDVSVFAVDSAGNKTTETYQVQILPVGSEKSPSSIDETTKTEEKTEEKKATATKQDTPVKNNSSNASAGTANNSTSTNTSKPSTNSGPSGSGSSASVTPPASNGGSANSSGSNSNTGNSGNNNSSSSTGNATTNTKPEQPQECDHLWRAIETQQKIVDKPAYDEQVVVPAYDETVLVSEAYDEPVYDIQYVATTICRYCGYTTTGPNQIDEMISHVVTDNGTYTTKTETIKTQTGTIHHDAVYETVHHEATTTTVHHDEEYHYEMVVIGYECYRCGKTK